MMHTHHLRLQSGVRRLVEALDWQIRAGECWCVIGKNGAGKTTLLRTLAGLRHPDSGEVQIDGRALRDWPLLELARRRAFLPQAHGDAFGYCALETVLAARHPFHANHRWESEADHAAAWDALKTMAVADLAQRDVRTLSGGERQRVAIAALLAQDAPLMLLDEPANALDLAHQANLMALLAQLCRERNKTIVMAGHDLNFAQRAATHALLLMGEGEWRAGTVAEVMTEEWLGRCLGHPVEAVQHRDRMVFVPAAQPLAEA